MVTYIIKIMLVIYGKKSALIDSHSLPGISSDSDVSLTAMPEKQNIQGSL